MPYYLILSLATTDDAELSHQLRLSEAKLVFTDAERLPIVKRAVQDVGLPADSVYLLKGNGDAPSVDGLLAYGELEWERVNQLEDLKQRLAYRSCLPRSTKLTGAPERPYSTSAAAPLACEKRA